MKTKPCCDLVVEVYMRFDFAALASIGLVASSVVFAGCGHAKGPLSPQDLEIVTNTKLDSQSLIKPDNVGKMFGQQLEISESDFRSALKSLLPLRETNSYSGEFDVALSYYTSDFVAILVKFQGDELIYRLGDFTYKGGDASKLRSVLDRVAWPSALTNGPSNPKSVTH